MLEAARQEHEATKSSWAPVDLAPIIDGTAGTDEPALLRRSDGTACMYPGKVHSVAGESESGKTWMGLLAARQVLLDNGHVMFFDFEDNERTVVQRLRDALVPDDAIVARFHYVRPDGPLDPVGNAALTMTFDRFLPSLAIVDGVTEGMVMHGLELKDNTDIAKWLALLPKPIAARGAAVLQIDHVAKDREGRGRFAIGGQHKLAGIDGAAFTIEVVRSFGRGLSGVARVLVSKDRPGWIRQHAPRDLVGELHVDSDPDGGVVLELVAPVVSVSAFRPTVIMERISLLLESNVGGLSKRAVRGGVNGKNDTKDLALELLVGEGFVRTERDGQVVRHVSVRPFRHDESGDE